MPRRLGDDPLARARAAGSSAPSAQGAVVEQGSGAAPRQSYNDVFFQRRADAPSQRPAAEQAPEISEISTIPEIREMAAAPTADAATAVAPAPAPVESGPAPQLSIIEEAVARINGAAASPPPAEEPAPAAQAPVAEEPAPGAQKSGGFFKRLFGKLK